jgi:hypothetical protein
MEKIFSHRVEDARKLGSFAFACLAIVICVGARACFAFFQEAIFSSLQEWLLLGNQRREPQQAGFIYRVAAKREASASAPRKDLRHPFKRTPKPWAKAS